MNLLKYGTGYQMHYQHLINVLPLQKALEGGKGLHQPRRENLILPLAVHPVHLSPIESFLKAPNRSLKFSMIDWKCSTYYMNKFQNILQTESDLTLPFSTFSLPFVLSWTWEIQRMKSMHQALIIQEPSQQNPGKNEEWHHQGKAPQIWGNKMS